MTIAEQKAAMRTESFARRKAAKASVDPAPATAALLRLVRTHTVGCRVSAYVPIRTEIDPIPAMRALHADGYQMCVPVVTGAARPLVFRPWVPDMPLVDGTFGTMVPADGPDVAPDVIIAPLLAFDARGFRLGYGGGFYDRTLAGLRKTQPVSAYGFAYEAQRVAQVPIEPTDMALDAIVTETGLTRPR